VNHSVPLYSSGIMLWKNKAYYLLPFIRDLWLCNLISLEFILIDIMCAVCVHVSKAKLGCNETNWIKEAFWKRFFAFTRVSQRANERIFSHWNWRVDKTFREVTTQFLFCWLMVLFVYSRENILRYVIVLCRFYRWEHWPINLQ